MAEVVHSQQFNTLYRRYNVEKSITEDMLRKYVKVKKISAAEFEEITGITY